MPPKQSTLFHSFPVIQTKRRLLNRPRANAASAAAVTTPAPSTSTSTATTTSMQEPKSLQIPVHAPRRSSPASPPPSQQQPRSRHSSPANLSDGVANQCLRGVVACIDVRTDDGDDVSANFEKALQTMGAKTRRTFSDTVTHLVFKNGSPTNLRKAMQNKQCKIVTLLWATNCKSRGERVNENEYLVEKPEALLAAAKTNRRKSMEPGQVRALMQEAPTTIAGRSSLPEKRANLSTSHDSLPKRFRAPASVRSRSAPNTRRKTLPVSHWEKSAIIPRSNEAARSFVELDEMDHDNDDQDANSHHITLDSPHMGSSTTASGKSSSEGSSKMASIVIDIDSSPPSNAPAMPSLSSFAKSMRRLSFRERQQQQQQQQQLQQSQHQLSSPQSYASAAAAVAAANAESKKKPTVSQSIKASFYIPTSTSSSFTPASSSSSPNSPSLASRKARQALLERIKSTKDSLP
ncbi:hypothetical protein BC940DRAFT_312203 [Gongronella butleri]|nr:hypothetical protein BC940DRAFT_312203 [Gongronella butleri]